MTKGKIFNDAVELFETSLKLLHPVMPFITEELWHGLNDGKDENSLLMEKMPECNDKESLPDVEEDIISVQNLISVIRNLRAEMNLAPSLKCDVSVSCTNKSNNVLLKSVKDYVIALGKIENFESGINLPKPSYLNITSVVGQFQVYLKIEGLIDIKKETARVQKEIERAESFLNSINKKLSNENFIAKASPEVISNEKKKYDDTVSKLEKLKHHLNSISC